MHHSITRSKRFRDSEPKKAKSVPDRMPLLYHLRHHHCQHFSGYSMIKSANCRSGQRHDWRPYIGRVLLQQIPFFVVPACHLADQDGLDQHFQASVHYPLTSGINKSQEYQNKIFVNAENQTQGRCVRIKNATSVPCSPTASASDV